MEPLTAALVAGGAMASGGLSAWGNYTGSKKLMNRQYELQMKQWNAQNEYNLPVNQMSRLVDAGLNPHLVYGNGGASATASLPSGVAQGHFNGANIDPLGDLANYQTILNQDQDLSNKKAQEKYTEAQTDNTRVTTREFEKTQKKQRELMNAQIKQTNASAGLTSENAFTQGLVNAIPRVITDNDTYRSISDGWDSFWDSVGDAAYGVYKFFNTDYEDYRFKSKNKKGYLY